MPRRPAGARLYRRPDTGIYVIRDTGHRELSTRTRDRRQAEGALARYIAKKGQPTDGPATPERMTVANALALYAENHGPTVRTPERIAYAIKALVPILGDLPVASINASVCRRYAETRNRTAGTVRRELGVLQASINYTHSEGYLTAPVKVKLPEKPAARDRWLTRDEAARLLRAAYRSTRGKHLARYILIGLYTGTRSETILGLRFVPNTEGGWVDTKSGMMYRRAIGQAETKKRTPTVPIPRPLLSHLRRWERHAARYVVEVDGQRVASVKTAWKRALAEAGIDHCTRHDLRHTAITWAMQRGADRWHATGYFGISLDMLERVYGHHHPDYMHSAVKAMERKR